MKNIKNILEMTLLMANSCFSKDCDNCSSRTFGLMCPFRGGAEALANAGYGDVKQAVREFAEKLERKIGALTVADDETYWFKCGFETLQEHLPEIIKEVRKEVCGE